MTLPNEPALNVAKAYVAAIASKDVNTIINLCAEDITCKSPIGLLTGLDKFRAFHEGFARMIIDLTVLATYGDEKQAVIVYEAKTTPVPSSIVAELIKVENGKLISTEVIYDPTPFVAYMANVQPH